MKRLFPALLITLAGCASNHDVDRPSLLERTSNYLVKGWVEEQARTAEADRQQVAEQERRQAIAVRDGPGFRPY